jgi:hypothetical protein
MHYHLAKMVGSKINFLTLTTKIMKTLEFGNLRIEELRDEETRAINGGCDGEGLCEVGYALAVYSFARGFLAGFFS